jgi:hypothetical protein
LGSTTTGATTQSGSTYATQAGSGTKAETTSTPFNPLSLLPLGFLPLSGTGSPSLAGGFLSKLARIGG